MARTTPAALAFYTRHPLDNDALGELDDKPEDVAENDWQKWRQVIALAGEQAGALATECREAALDVLNGKITIGSKCIPKTAAKHWGAWAEVFVGKLHTKLWVGSAVSSDPNGATWVCSYVSLQGGVARVQDLRAALDQAGVDRVQADTTWFDRASVVLAQTRLVEGADLDEIVQESRHAWERFAEALPALARLRSL